MIKYAIKGKDKAPPSGLLGKAAEKFPNEFKSKASAAPADDEDMDEEDPEAAPEADAEEPEESSADCESCVADLFAAMDNHDLKKGAAALEAFINAIK